MNKERSGKVRWCPNITELRRGQVWAWTPSLPHFHRLVQLEFTYWENNLYFSGRIVSMILGNWFKSCEPCASFTFALCLLEISSVSSKWSDSLIRTVSASSLECCGQLLAKVWEDVSVQQLLCLKIVTPFKREEWKPTGFVVRWKLRRREDGGKGTELRDFSKD